MTSASEFASAPIMTADALRSRAIPCEIGEMVNNVVSNAIRNTPHGGHVVIDCRPAEGCIALDVTDAGLGVEHEGAEYIFDSGYRGRAPRETSGSGIGLALTKRFVEEHRGSIDVHGVAGHGNGAAVFVRFSHVRGKLDS